MFKINVLINLKCYEDVTVIMIMMSYNCRKEVKGFALINAVNINCSLPRR